MHRSLPFLACLLAVSCGGSTEPADPTVPASITLSSDTMSIYPGRVWRSGYPTAVVYNSAHQVLVRSVTWSSADPSVAIITDGGSHVQGVAEGTATITATAGSATASFQLHVIREPVSTVLTNLANPTYLYALDSVQIVGTAYGPGLDALNDRTVTIVSHQPDIASVSSTGMIHIQSSGIARIFYESEGVFDSVSIYADVRRVARIAIVPNSVTLVIGQDSPGWSCHLFDASDADLGNRPIAWSSSDTTVTQPSYCGAIPIGVGTAIITGRADTASAQVNVIVTAAP